MNVILILFSNNPESTSTGYANSNSTQSNSSSSSSSLASSTPNNQAGNGQQHPPPQPQPYNNNSSNSAVNFVNHIASINSSTLTGTAQNQQQPQGMRQQDLVRILKKFISMHSIATLQEQFQN